MGQQIEKLAQFVAATQWEQIPDSVQRHAKLVVLDTLGVMLAGSERPESQGLRKALKPTVGRGATVFAQGWPGADPRSAALMNGIAARSIELSEGHRYVMFQGGAQILAGVLAVAESAQSSGREILAAFTLAYDLGARLSLAMKPRALAHQNGQTALVAAAAAGARLRKFDVANTSLAMRIAATLMMTPSYTNAIAGATTLNVAGGMSSFAAALVPDLTVAGFTAQEDAIEESLMHLVADGFDAERAIEELGKRWEITRNWFRLRACCNPVYAALEALEATLVELRPQPADVERIDVATFGFAAAMRNADPPNYFASKYSLPHAAAGMVINGNAGYASLNDASVQDPAFAAMRHRVHITEDPAMTALAPARKIARVTLTLRDGRRSTHSCDGPMGDYKRPYKESDIRGKFHELAGGALTAAGTAAVEETIDRAEEWQDVGELISVMHQHSRTRDPANSG